MKYSKEQLRDEFIKITPNDLAERNLRLRHSYKQMFENPEEAEPKYLFMLPSDIEPVTWEEKFADPGVMLRSNFYALAKHWQVDDDFVSAVRIDFGTGQVAKAFGCDIFFPANDIPCAMNHVLDDIKKVDELKTPELTAGWFGQVDEWTELWQSILPDSVELQHPDIQSPFNNAHLIRGNDILFDFYDDPERVHKLMNIITDYMIDLTVSLKSKISSDKEYFYDYGAMWKGFARLSDCTVHLVSPEQYIEFIKPYDEKFLNAINGGRIHYCGTPGNVIQHIFSVQNNNGLDLDGSIHSPFDMEKIAGARQQILFSTHSESALIKQLLDGNWPKKKNLVFLIGGCKNVQDAIELKSALKKQFHKYRQ